MIHGIKDRMVLVEEIQDSVEIAHEVTDVVVENYEPINLPSVMLFYGPNKYAENDNPARVRQTVEKYVSALLYCDVADLDDLEAKIVQACLGYKKNANWDMPLIADESVTVKINAQFCVRRITFVLTGRVTQSPL